MSLPEGETKIDLLKSVSYRQRFRFGIGSKKFPGTGTW